MPTVSICIPTYNRKQYLKPALDSVFSQTYKNYEVIVVDDGSTDGTEEFIKRLVLPLSYVRQTNQGATMAKNALISKTSGKYVMFLDSDDLLYADSLQRLMEVIGTSEDKIAYGSYVRIDHDGRVIGRDKRKLYSGNITIPLFKSIIVHSCGTLFPANILHQYGGFNKSLSVCSDYELFLRLSLKYEFVAASGPVFLRRRHTSNISSYGSGNLLTELGVLESFYYQHGGREAIPERIAKKRLARQCYRIAKCACRENSRNLARKMVVKSLGYRFGLKPVLLRVKMFLGR